MNAGTALSLRSAEREDRRTIVALLESEGLDPRFVPEQFVVAEEGGQLLGCARLRPLGEGGRELASVAVRPGRRGEGIGRTLVERTLARAEEPVYALCLEPGFFEHVGFQRLDRVPDSLEAKARSCCAEREFVPMVWRSR